MVEMEQNQRVGIYGGYTSAITDPIGTGTEPPSIVDWAKPFSHCCGTLRKWRQKWGWTLILLGPNPKTPRVIRKGPAGMIYKSSIFCIICYRWTAQACSQCPKWILITSDHNFCTSDWDSSTANIAKAL